MKWRDYGDFLREQFPYKVQKISVNAGFTCPNRDGTKGRGGCTYCNNRTFNPEYCRPVLTVTEQLEQGKRFFGRKYKDMRYLAYFQAYTNTYGDEEQLMRRYEEALNVPDVVGVVIATRPDCVSDTLLERLAELRRRAWVMVEYGAETACERTLRLINRCHTWTETVDAVERTAAAGIECGAHFILGLPGEDEDTMMRTVEAINGLPLSTVKFHQLQVIRGTELARQLQAGEVEVIRWTAEEYAQVCARVLQRLRPDIAVERFVSQSPAELLIFPRWGLKNYQFANLLRKMEPEAGK